MANIKRKKTSSYSFIEIINSFAAFCYTTERAGDLVSQLIQLLRICKTPKWFEKTRSSRRGFHLDYSGFRYSFRFVKGFLFSNQFGVLWLLETWMYEIVLCLHFYLCFKMFWSPRMLQLFRRMQHHQPPEMFCGLETVTNWADNDWIFIFWGHSFICCPLLTLHLLPSVQYVCT